MGWSPGDRIGADFRLVSPLGEHLRVWKAKRLSDDEAVAITFASTGDEPLAPVTRSRFAGGAKLWQELEHPNILPCIGFGLAEGVPYTVSPLIDGESLAARLRRERVLPQDTLVALLEQLALALEHLHEREVVHRDLRPSHVLLPKGDEERVLLHGLEVAHRSEPGTPPDSDRRLATHDPAYAAPEMPDAPQLATPRADLFSLGAIAYHGLLGRALVTPDAPPEYFPPTELSPFLPEAVDRFFERALAEDPASRFDDALELVHALDDALGGTFPVSAAPRERLSTAPLSSMPPSAPPTVASSYPTLDRLLYITVAIAALLAGAAIASMDGWSP